MAFIFSLVGQWPLLVYMSLKRSILDFLVLYFVKTKAEVILSGDMEQFIQCLIMV